MEEFDDYFVSRAPRREPSAAERIANQRRLAHAKPQPWRTYSLAEPPAPPARRKGGRQRRGTLVGLVMVGITLASVVQSGVIPRALGFRGGFLVAAHSVDAPPAPGDLSSHPLGIPQRPPAGQGGYAFSVTQPRTGQPVTWDPCRPIHYVVRPDGAPPAMLQMLPAALSQLSAATGLRFVSDGYTSEAPAAKRAAYQPNRYGNRWAPALIAWTTPEQLPALAGPVSGLGGPTVFGTADPRSRRLVSGQVAFDGPQLAAAALRSNGEAILFQTELHELGHLVGLAHVPDADEIMYPQSTGWLMHYGPGDLRGLAQLGAGTCFRDH
jgi:hypothetical protein